MARARNIKPGFFTNDVLAELPPLARLLFAGLWTLCDREGRAEDRPKRIRAEVLAYDDCDCDALLQALHDKGFIRRYEVAGTRVIQVLAWDKHQNPHMKEAASTLPAYDEHRTSTVLAPDKAQPLPERAGLIPDSGYLIPDSIEEIEPSALVVCIADDERQVVELGSKTYRVPDCPYEEIVEAYAQALPALPQVAILSKPRKAHMQARWRQVCAAEKFDREQGLEWFRWYFRHVSRSDFLNGRGGGRDAQWRADFEWLLLPNNFAKCIENRYHKDAA